MNLHKMKATLEESTILDWRYAPLSEEQCVQCEEEAMERAGAELNQDEAAELLARMYTRMIVRNVRAECNQGSALREP
jgi:hypothetical protein